MYSSLISFLSALPLLLRVSSQQTGVLCPAGTSVDLSCTAEKRSASYSSGSTSLFVASFSCPSGVVACPLCPPGKYGVKRTFYAYNAQRGCNSCYGYNYNPAGSMETPGDYCRVCPAGTYGVPTAGWTGLANAAPSSSSSCPSPLQFYEAVIGPAAIQGSETSGSTMCTFCNICPAGVSVSPPPHPP